VIALEPLEVKGKSDPIEAFVVHEEVAELEGETFVPTAPLVGREDELTALRSAFDTVRDHSAPMLVTIVGDPGIGKTRLVTEFLGSLEREAHVTRGRCLPYGGGITLWPLRDILVSEAELLPTEGPNAALTKLAGFAGRIPPDVYPPERMRAALAVTLGLQTGHEAFSGLDPREVQREVLTAWTLLIASMARERPLILVIEDLHWADEATLGVLDEVVRRADAPVLILCPTRPELLTSQIDWLADLKQHTSISLRQLDLENSAELMSHLLGARELPPTLHYRVLERTEGNPFSKRSSGVCWMRRISTAPIRSWLFPTTSSPSSCRASIFSLHSRSA